MSHYLILIGMVFAAALGIVTLRERSLYVLFGAAYTHSLVVPFLYTHGYIGKDLAWGLLLLKDILLLELFAWSVILLFSRFRGAWPLPIKLLLLLTGYCGFRFLLGTVFLDDDGGIGLLRMKFISFPLEIIVVVMVLTALHPEFGNRFLRNMTYILSCLAVVSLIIFFAAPRDFWVQNANLAEYNADVKGDTENEQDFSQGISGSGGMGARAEAFADLINFRAIGTFGDGLSLSFQMTVPVLLLLFYFPRKPTEILMLSASAAALLCSLSRSGWLFCALVVTYVLLRRRHYLPFFMLGCLVLGLVVFWPPMTQFAVATVSNLKPSSENANPNDDAHVEGLFGFYTRGFSDPGNILGKGMRPEMQSIPESGYAYLLEHFGIVAYVSFLGFCIALYREFGGSRADPLGVLVQGVSLGILVVMHFSQYPLAFTAFISLWYIVGFSLSRCLLPKTNPGEEPSPLLRCLPLGNTSLGPSVAR
jgi:hypothetical protein